jgi:hypothetical protein
MTKEQRLKRASEARFVLENPAYIEAVEKITSDIRYLRLALSPRDTEGAHRLVLMEQAVERAKRLMESYLEDGELAKKELQVVAEPSPIGRLNARFSRLTRGI